MTPSSVPESSSILPVDCASTNSAIAGRLVAVAVSVWTWAAQSGDRRRSGALIGMPAGEIWKPPRSRTAEEVLVGSDALSLSAEAAGSD